MKTAVILGAGRLAGHLAPALTRSGLKIIQVYSRTADKAACLAGQVQAPHTCSIDTLDYSADAYFFCLSDDAIIPVLRQARFADQLLVHSAGSVSMDIFKGYSSNYGVFYPLQSFSEVRIPEWSVIPLCIEGNREDSESVLTELARKISGTVLSLDSEKRRLLHLAAVVASNFSNHMYTLAWQLAAQSGLDPSLLIPLIRETTEKVIVLCPAAAQTGPAIRADEQTIKEHIALLHDKPEIQKIYTFVSGSINPIHTGQMTNFKEELGRVRAFIFYVDGVLSDAKIYLHPQGELMRSMNIRDGYAIQYAIRKGYPVAIITGGNSDNIKIRFSHLGVTDIYLKSQNKMTDLHDFLGRHNLAPGEVLYMGDDLPDYEVMKAVGVPTCPANADSEIKALAKYISAKDGGDGCARDVIEQVLRLQGRWMDEDAFHW